MGLIFALSLALAPGFANAHRGHHSDHSHHSHKGKHHHKGHHHKGKEQKAQVSVMTRNLYLGADLGPALESGTPEAFIRNVGDVWNQVVRTNFPARAKSLAAEIRSQDADLVGLQEAALWKTGPPGGPATSVAYDFTKNLLDELNKGVKTKKQYQLAVSRNEFDFEAPAKTSGPVDPNPPLFGATMDIRLTMRDAIIVKKGSVEFNNPQTGGFVTIFTPPTAVGTIPVPRGWVSVDAKVNGGKQFHLVDTHLEAFDGRAANPSSTGVKLKGGIRQAQAQELLAGPLNEPSLPVILVGDLNSDSPVNGDQVSPGDELGYLALTGGGFSERATPPPFPFSCCIADPNLMNPSAGGITHRVDHIMSNSSKATFKKGAVTSTFAHHLWSSDHFGVASELKVK